LFGEALSRRHQVLTAPGLAGEARIVNHSSGARMTPSGRLQAKFLEKNGGNLGGNTGASFFGIMMTMMGLSGGRWVRYKMVRLCAPPADMTALACS